MFMGDGRRERRQMRRNRIFRDRNHPFELFDDVELFQKFRFRRHDILEIADKVSDAIQKTNRKGTLPPLLQVMTALRFYVNRKNYHLINVQVKIKILVKYNL